jgi:hypothetical protein
MYIQCINQVGQQPVVQEEIFPVVLDKTIMPALEDPFPTGFSN